MKLYTKTKLKIILFICLFLCFSIESSASLIKKDSKSKKDSIVRILAIGNSFSEDAMEHFLFDLAKADGKKVIIANLFIGASDLDLHWKNASGDIGKYNYRKIGVNGQKTKTPGVSISTALADEKWDYISFQQVSTKSGLYDTYVSPLTNLLAYVKNKSHPKTKYILHQTWAYRKSSPVKRFEKYGNSQEAMYKVIVETTRKIKRDYDFDLLIPSGTAIQNARTSFIGDNLNRDDLHLSLFLGRYIASCAWYEMIFKTKVIGNKFFPDNVTTYQAEMAQYAAHYACKKPYRVTELKKFKNVK
ncbi:hypothetical protein PBAC_05380 [Pedobacter glucosidilyticus]|nr:DUF4886 domain-containing protein [Pedobacter glucosidilyticus]KHJ39224.1 hypothetical protein PBAC_05380 [Pedobacter glucosidilyticus]